MYTTKSVLLLTVPVIIILVWYESLRIRESVTRMCRQICKKSELQLLDQTVSLASLSCKRAGDGRLYLYRIYRFEVSSNGIDRFAGYVTMAGKHVETIRIDGEDGMTTIYPSSPDTIH